MFKNIFKNHLVKSVLVIASGTAAAQLIGMIFVPFITRIYGPEVYGLLGTFLALTAVLTPFSALAYPMAIVLPKEDSKAKALVKISLILSAVLSIIIFSLLWVSGEWLLTVVGASALLAYMFFIPAVMLLTAWQDIAMQWLIRKKTFKSIAHVAIVQSFIKNISQSVAGLYAPFASVLIAIHTLSVAFSAILLRLVGEKITSPKAEYVSVKDIKSIAYEYRDFPLYRAPQVILNAASQGLPVLMLAAFFGPAAAGFYALTRTVLGLPLNLLGGSVQSVFYPHFNDAVLEKKKTLALLLKSIGGLAVIGVWPFLIVIVFGPYLFSLVFGVEWGQAGNYAQWLAIWMFFNLINRPSIAAIPVLKLQRWFLGFEIVSVMLRVAAIYFGFYYLKSELAAVALFSIIGALLSAYIMLKTVMISRQLDKTNQLISQ